MKSNLDENSMMWTLYDGNIGNTVLFRLTLNQWLGQSVWAHAEHGISINRPAEYWFVGSIGFN